MSWLPWVIALLVIAVILGVYLSATAGRLDRLHHRVDNGLEAMDIALRKRSAYAGKIAESLLLDPATSIVILEAAGNASVAEAEGDPLQRAQVESDLTRTLAVAFDSAEFVSQISNNEPGTHLVSEISDAVHRTAMSRRFYNDAVRACRAVRRQHLVRWFRLAGSAPYPKSAEFDDSVPIGLLDR